MNRRAAKARDRRKQHAAAQRRVQRLFSEAMKRFESAIVHAIMVAQQAVRRVLAEGLTLPPGMRFGSHGQMFSSGGPVGSGNHVHSGEVAAQLSAYRHMQHPAWLTSPRPEPRINLSEGLLYARECGTSGPLKRIGTTGPITFTLQTDPPTPRPTCGSCGEVIRPDPMTGTACGCTPRRPFRHELPWSPLLCTCTGDGEQCEYCAAHFAGQA